MSVFTLAISCLTTSNLPWFTDLTFQVPMWYCSLQHLICFHHQSHPQLGVVFVWLWLFILSGVISPLVSHRILGTYDLESSSFSVPSFCLSYSSWGSQGKNSDMGCHSVLQWTTFFRALHHNPSILGGPTLNGSQSHWIRQGCVPCDQTG